MLAQVGQVSILMSKTHLMRFAQIIAARIIRASALEGVSPDDPGSLP